MKPLRIATLDGIYVLDEKTGFYEPYAEPEPKYPLWFLGYGWPAIFILAIGISGAACAAWRHFA